MNVLFLGDIVGKPGRHAVTTLLPRLIRSEGLNLVVANCENVAGGAGIDAASVRELLNAGVDVLTSGNHVWRRREMVDFIQTEPRLLRPANFPPGTPGTGWTTIATLDGVRVGVINLIGRVFMDSVDCPFQAVEAILPAVREETPVIFVDMHGEASSEKGAMAWFLDGQVSAVLGSHTHVPTADERVLPLGTAFQTDAGMCGPIDSVIGVKAELAIRRFRTHMPTKFEVAGGRSVVNGAVVSIDATSGRARAIKRLQEYVDR